MLDSQGRINIGTQIRIEGTKISFCQKVEVYYDDDLKRLIITSEKTNFQGNIYYLATQSIDEKGRISVPSPLRKAFPNATYLPAEKEGEIYILIFENGKKPE